MRFTLAHITDLHMGPMIFFGPRYWNVKRLLGMANWYRGRRRAHRLPVLQAIVEDMLRQAPDHIAVTGDLVNIGLPEEHQRALSWLQRLGSPEGLSVVPGNHDIYTRLGSDDGALRWRQFMSDNAAGAIFRGGDGDRDGECESFPFIRRFGDVALIGVNSAMPTRPFIAAGRVGDRQRQRLVDCLARLGDGGLTRIVLIHHPPLPGQASPTRALKDAEALRSIIAAQGAELVLHGHNHRNMLAWCQRNGEAAAVPVVGAPSASMGRCHHGEPLARYNLYRIDTDRRQGGGLQGSGGDGAEVTIEMVGRGFAEPGGDIVELERRILRPGEGLR